MNGKPTKQGDFVILSERSKGFAQVRTGDAAGFELNMCTPSDQGTGTTRVPPVPGPVSTSPPSGSTTSPLDTNIYQQM
jgi:hypothetical protein